MAEECVFGERARARRLCRVLQRGWGTGELNEKKFGLAQLFFILFFLFVFSRTLSLFLCVPDVSCRKNEGDEEEGEGKKEVACF